MDENTTNSNESGIAKSPKLMLIIAGVVILGLIGFVMARNNGGEEHDEAMMNGHDDSAMVMPESNETGGPAMETEDGASAEVKTIAVEGGNFYFNPNEIRVKQGEKVRVVLTGKGMPHDFVVDELGVRTPIIQDGNTATVEFTADKIGTFEYYCSVGQHRKNGMVGKLIVE